MKGAKHPGSIIEPASSHQQTSNQEASLTKGAIVLLRRPLADLICEVVWVNGDEVAVRYLDAPRKEGYNVVKREDLVVLAPKQDLDEPDFYKGVEREIAIVLPEKQKKIVDLEAKLRAMDPEVIEAIVKMLERGEENGKVD